MMKRNVTKISDIIKGLKTVIRDGSFDEKQRIRLDDVMKDVLLLSQERIRSSGIEVTYENPNPQLQVLCSAAQIGQVLANLITNAFDAIGALPSPWVKIKATETSSGVEVRVMDSGAGIPADQVEKIFKPFVTSKPAGKGTGLGLSISRRIMKSHGGQLTVDRSCPNTCFLMTLLK